MRLKNIKLFDYQLQIIAIATAIALSACSHYQPHPLTEETVQNQLQTPSTKQLTIQLSKIKHPLLKNLNFDIRDGLSPDEAAILAVLRNPKLRALRDQQGIASAQLLQAGLLPDPQISYSFSVSAISYRGATKSPCDFSCIS